MLVGYINCLVIQRSWCHTNTEVQEKFSVKAGIGKWKVHGKPPMMLCVFALVPWGVFEAQNPCKMIWHEILGWIFCLLREILWIFSLKNAWWDRTIFEHFCWSLITQNSGTKIDCRVMKVVLSFSLLWYTYSPGTPLKCHIETNNCHIWKEVLYIFQAIVFGSYVKFQGGILNLDTSSMQIQVSDPGSMPRHVRIDFMYASSNLT